jgi:hypothetical protein
LSSLVSLSFKMFKRTWFVMVSSLCTTLYFQPLIYLEWRRLKFSANCFVRSLIMVIIFSLLF